MDVQLKKEEGDVELEDRRARKNVVMSRGNRDSKALDEIELQGYDEEEALLKSPAHDPANRGDESDNTSVPAMESVPRYFKGSWPSAFEYTMFYIRPGADVWVLFGILFFYLWGPKPAEGDSVLWTFILNNKNSMIWIPFTWRLFRGFFHWILSHAILPGPLLYNEGPLVKYYPKFLAKTVEESFMFREMCRPRLVHAGGIPISMLTPDGVLLDAMYFKGQDTEVTGPTVIRFNGNAEAYELQDDVLPRNYTANGINILMFNYRGVGRSRWQPLFKSEMAGWLIGFWRTPTIIGTFLDTCTIVEYAIKALGVDPKQLVLLGHSIGGAIATQYAAKNPSIPLALCSSRSFANLVGVAVRLAPAYFGMTPTNPKAVWLRRFAYVFLNLVGWEYDSVGNWKKVEGFKWIEYSSADHIIPYDLSLHAVLKAQLDAAGGANPENLRVIPLIDINGVDNHNRLLFDSEMVQHLEMVLSCTQVKQEV